MNHGDLRQLRFERALHLNALYNGTVVGAFLICALSIGASVFLIRELDTPLNGVIAVSSEPMKNAQAHLG